MGSQAGTPDWRRLQRGPRSRTRRLATAIELSSPGPPGSDLSSHGRQPGPSTLAGLPSNDPEVTPGAAAASGCWRQSGNSYGKVRGREGRGSCIVGLGREMWKVAEAQQPTVNLFFFFFLRPRYTHNRLGTWQQKWSLTKIKRGREKERSCSPTLGTGKQRSRYYIG